MASGMTVKEAAKRLGIAPGTVRRRIRRGEIQATKVPAYRDDKGNIHREQWDVDLEGDPAPKSDPPPQKQTGNVVPFNPGTKTDREAICREPKETTDERTGPQDGAQETEQTGDPEKDPPWILLAMIGVAVVGWIRR